MEVSLASTGYSVRNELGQFVPLQPRLEPSEELAYVIGVILGDGYLEKYYDKKSSGYCYTVRLEVIDEDFARRRRGKTLYCVKARSAMLYKWLKSLNLEKIGAMLQSERMKAAFLRGFFDSEGSISSSGGRRFIDFYNKNKELMVFIEHLLEELNIDTYNLYENKVCWVLRVNPKSHRIFLSTIKPTFKEAD